LKIESIVTQARSLSFAHTASFTSKPAEDLANFVLQESDGAFSRAYFLCSGSEAIEAALKLARQYHLMNDEPERINIIGRECSYHGNTLGALAAGHNPARRDPFAPLLGPNFHHVSRCFYDYDGIGLSEAEYEDKLIAEFEAKFVELGTHTIAAVIVEPVVGATIGTVPATKTYLPRLKALCEKYGALVIFDEVMGGMGRLGTYHAWQTLGGVSPDLQTIGKGLAAGYQPVSGVLISKKVYDVYARVDEKTGETKPFISAHTYQGHSIGCAAALTVQTIVKRDGLVARAKAMGEVLRKSLLDGPKSIELTVRGSGLFRTVDFGSTGQRYGGVLAKEVQVECFKQGAAVYVCGAAVDAILFAPPFIITEEEIKKLTTTFWNSVQTVLEKRAKPT
jgi:adenosylmethionine-8-amino-7-oxononanoate aminotransferase